VAVLDEVVQALTGASIIAVTGAGQFAIASTGTLAWVPGRSTPFPDRSIVMVDRQGRVAPLPGSWRTYGASVRRSPDGRQLAVTIRNLSEVGVWLHDLDRGVLTALAGGGEANWPLWSPDGKRIAFSWLEDGRRSIAVMASDGTAAPHVLLAGSFSPSSWTPDGQQLVGLRSWEIVVVTAEDVQARARPLFETAQSEAWPELSPDGRWMAYGSNTSGRDEVYIRPFPGPGAAEQVSLSGGSSPAWHPNGEELFFVGPGNSAGQTSMMSVEFEAGSPRHIGRPMPLFDFRPADLLLECSPLRCYDVAPDGQGFYAGQSRTIPPLPPVTHVSLIQNWFEELKQNVPIK
jgi:serine/threonine-protein kinase